MYYMPSIKSEIKGYWYITIIALILLLFLGVIVLKHISYESLASHKPFSKNSSMNLPKIILWAWERPEILNFIDSKEVGVAFLMKTLYLSGDEVIVRPRLQPLTVPQGTRLIGVVRIEWNRFSQPILSSGLRDKLASAIVDLTHAPEISALQIDFDALESQRGFYRKLLLDVRRKLPDSMPLSMTALASWCIYDSWLSELPVDEAVPMLFRMGADHRQVHLYLTNGKDFVPDICRHSLGISADESIPRLPANRRVYVFNPESWSPDAMDKIMMEVKKSE